MVKQIPYVEGMKYKAKLSLSVAEVATAYYFMCIHLNILNICEHVLCLLLIRLNWDSLLWPQFLFSVCLSELSTYQKTILSDF